MTYRADQDPRMAQRRWPYPSTAVPANAEAGPGPPPRRVAAALAVIFLALYALTYSATLTSRDGGVMYDTAMAIVERHRLALPPHHHGMPGVNGGFYSKYGIALSVAEIPLYLLGRAISGLAPAPLSGQVALAVAMLVNPLIAALCVAAFFLLAYELCWSQRRSLLVAVLFGLAGMLWPYAKTDFSEPLSTLCLIGAVLYLVRARNRGGTPDYLWAGLFAGLSLLAKLTAGFVLPALGLYAIYVAATADRTAPGPTGTHPEGRSGAIHGPVPAMTHQGQVVPRPQAGGPRRLAWRLLCWGLGVAGGIGLSALYNLVRFGRLTDSGYRAEDLPFHAPFLTGLSGLLVSPGKGLLWYCPLVLVALVLWPRFLARHRAEALLALGMLLPTVGVYATYPVWWGGVCWGPRYLLPVLPFVLFPLVLWPSGPESRALWRYAAGAVAAISIGVQVLGVGVHPNRFPATGITDAQYLWVVSDSPLLGNAWLLGYDVVRTVRPSAAPAMLAGYPWQRPGGTSPTQRLAISSWPFWWWDVLARYGLERRAQAAIAALLLLVMAGGLWGLLRSSEPAELAGQPTGRYALRG